MNDKWSVTYGDDLFQLLSLTETQLEEIRMRSELKTGNNNDVTMLLGELELQRRACYFYMTKATRGRRKKI